MTVKIEITGESAKLALHDLGDLARSLLGAYTPMSRGDVERAVAGALGQTASENIDKAQVAALGQVPEEPRRGRGRPPKKTTVADLPPEAVEAAEAAGVHVEDESRLDQPEAKVDEPETVDEPVELTLDQVKSMIIDTLNWVVGKFPDDPDIRTRTIVPLLDRLNAEKISKIDPSRYCDVPALLDQIRADPEGWSK